MIVLLYEKVYKSHGSEKKADTNLSPIPRKPLKPAYGTFCIDVEQNVPIYAKG
jgi:hypothetical protein